MKKFFAKHVEEGRLREGQYGSYSGELFGFFSVISQTRTRLNAVVSSGEGWDHVSVSTPSGRLPNWNEMCWVKSLFFEDGETVIQYHPAKSVYVDTHEVLHLWRPHNQEIPMPPQEMV